MKFAIPATILLAIAAAAASGQTSSLTLDPQGASNAHLGYFPVLIPLTDVKPTQIIKEPEYRAKPKYGLIRLGNGPKSDYVFALDEPANADSKIYIDKNQNGDLTDDGDGAWNTKRTKGRLMYGVMPVTLRASYGSKTKETRSSSYTLGLYRFPDLANLICFRQTSRDGRIVIDGKPHDVMLVENDANAIFTGKAQSDKNTRPVWLVLDAAKGKRGTVVDIRGPFNLEGKAYEAKVSADGFNLRVIPTVKTVVAEAAPPPSPPLLKKGTPAPEFLAEKWGGGNLKLSDYHGKVLVLDFWATWCGPCQKSMPHIEKVFQEMKGEDVAVVGVCVWDDRDAYKEWIPKNQEKYSFQFAFDPAGRGAANIAAKLFNVSGIPTTYVIDKDGNVADAIVGYDDGDTRLEDALKKLGVKI